MSNIFSKYLYAKPEVYVLQKIILHRQIHFFQKGDLLHRKVSKLTTLQFSLRNNLVHFFGFLAELRSHKNEMKN